MCVQGHGRKIHFCPRRIENLFNTIGMGASTAIHYFRLMMLRLRGCTGVLIARSLLCLDSRMAVSVW